MKDIAMAVAKEFKPQGYSIPTSQLPYFMVWMAGFFNKSVKNNILPRIGKVIKADNTRVSTILYCISLFVYYREQYPLYVYIYCYLQSLNIFANPPASLHSVHPSVQSSGNY